MENIIISSFAISATPKEPAPDWQDSANCLGADPALFYPERGASTREAREVCQACDVQPDCLEFSLQRSEKFGIWGGLSQREIRRVRRQRSQVAGTTISATMTSSEKLVESEFSAPIDTQL
jgi:WhiB family redox-sensing transcriptional regulator